MNNRPNEVTEQFFKLLEQHFEDLLAGRVLQMYHTKEFADIICLHPNYFTQIVTEQTGKSVCEWIELKTLQEAQKLLTQTSKPIAQIAFDLTYHDASNFTKFFKKFAGVTPSQYRVQQVKP